jgi:hypothetical protein
LAYQLISWLFGFIGVKLFGFPQWIVPCMIFNNATSLPLLLLQALGKIGTLKSLVGEGEGMSEVLARGKVSAASRCKEGRKRGDCQKIG